VILDEAQNTTPEQMKMFLTRLGFGSRMVVTGDVTQIDLPQDQPSGLVVVGEILDGIEGIEFVRFGDEDVVRHKLVQRIVAAYNRYAQQNERSSARAAGERRDRRRDGVGQESREQPRVGEGSPPPARSIERR
ncbi:MAG: PhoH family protein, partial [Thermoleophilum sp.]|nr:PhoH family protein [Thermoleophilum sp.]